MRRDGQNMLPVPEAGVLCARFVRDPAMHAKLWEGLARSIEECVIKWDDDDDVDD